MGSVNSARVHCSKLTCQQLQVEPKKKEKKKEETRETRNAAVDVESKHILDINVIAVFFLLALILIFQ